MPFFMVKCYAGGKAKGDPCRIEARDALEAAEKICGGSLIEGAKPGNIRAEVLSLERPRPMTAYRDKTE